MKIIDNKNYCVVDAITKTISNIIVADEQYARRMPNWQPYYEGATIGDFYNPPKPVTIDDRVVNLETISKSASDRLALLSDCVIDIASM